MKKTFIDTDNLNTISDCLQQLVNAEEAQLSIKEQLARSNCSSDWSVWRKKAENALQVIKGIFDYIEVFYNRAWRHTHLGDVSLEAFEKASS